MEETTEKKEHRRKHCRACPSEAIYGLGTIGAAVYYLQHSTTFVEGLTGIIKAIGWPAVLLYKVLGMLGM